MQGIKLNPILDLTKEREILKKEFKKLKQFFKKNKIEWYIQSSFATNWYGCKERMVTDLDIRINFPIKELYGIVKKEYNSKAELRQNIRYEHGEFRNGCIIIPFWKTHIDITSDIITYIEKDNQEYNLPFDKDYKKINFRGVLIPICSIRYLLIYKLIHKRSKNERKNDLQEVGILLKNINNK